MQLTQEHAQRISKFRANLAEKLAGVWPQEDGSRTIELDPWEWSSLIFTQQKIMTDATFGYPDADSTDFAASALRVSVTQHDQREPGPGMIRKFVLSDNLRMAERLGEESLPRMQLISWLAADTTWE